MKKLILFVLIAFVIIFAGISTTNATTEYDLSILKNCKLLSYDCNKNGAFVIGADANTLYSAKILPDYGIKQLKIYGVIKAISQSGKLAYAIFDDDNMDNIIKLAELNTDNGSYRFFEVEADDYTAKKYFSVSEGYLYLIRKDDIYSYVRSYELSSGKTCDFKYDMNIFEIFNNNGASYAKLYNGTVYRLNGFLNSLCVSSASSYKSGNAGVNYIFTDKSKLISLVNGESEIIAASGINAVSTSGGNIFYVSNGKLFCLSGGCLKTAKSKIDAVALLSYGNKSAVISSDLKVDVISTDEYKSNKNQSQTNNTQPSSDKALVYSISSDKIVYNVSPKTTFAQFKRNFPTEVEVYNTNDALVTSGYIKTGYKITYNGYNYLISVKGDLTQNGKISSKDISLLMDYLVEEKTLSDVIKTSADYNLDGKVNNKDLVLLSKKSLDRTKE